MAVLDFTLIAREVAQVPSRANTLYGFMGSFGPMAFIAVCLRLYTRARFTKLGADDIAISVGLVLYTGLIVATVYAAKYGLGMHMSDVPLDTEVQMQKCGFTSQVLYPASLGVIKLSILLFLLRVLPPDHTWRKPLYGLAGWVVVSESAFTIALFLQCQPLAFYWDKTIEGTCFDQPKFYYTDACLNMLTDLVILSLPWFIFRSLNVSRRRKYELLLVCSVGVFTLITSIVRLPYLHNLNQSKDPTWDVVDIVIWSVAELGSAITLSSVPAIRPLVAHYVGGGLLSTAKSRSGAGTGGASSQSATVSAQRHHHQQLSTKGGSALTSQTGSAAAFAPYTELDDIDDLQKNRRSGDAESQERIFEHAAAKRVSPAAAPPKGW